MASDHTNPILCAADPRGSVDMIARLPDAADQYQVDAVAMVGDIGERGGAYRAPSWRRGCSPSGAPLELPPARIDIRTAQEIDEAPAETVRRIDRTVGPIGRGAGLETEVLAVAELPQLAVQRRSSGSRASETAAPCSSPPAPAPRSSQPRPNGDPAGVGGMPESLIIAFVLIGISVGKGAHRPVERVPGAEIAADRDRVA